MTTDYEVFEPNNEHLARIIIRIFEERGYNASYQLGYPNNKIFIKVDTKEEADRISMVIRRFMKEYTLTDRGLTTSKLDTLTSKLGSLIPEKPDGKQERLVVNVEKKTENNNIESSEISNSEGGSDAELEELRRKIAERLNLLNTQIAEAPKDRSNEKRRIERDTLLWVLQNMPYGKS